MKNKLGFTIPGTQVVVNKDEYDKMLKNAPSVAEGMVTITELAQSDPKLIPTNDKRFFTDEKGVFQEMDQTNRGKVVAE